MRVLLMFCCCMLAAFYSNAYWQQHTATNIAVVLDDRNHFLHGLEKITYTNNSPDTLQYIYMHLWPNAYKNDRTKFCEQQVLQGKTDFYFSPEKDKGYIDSLSFSIDGYRVDFDYADGNADIIRIALPRPLLPGTLMHLETPFRVKIPRVFSRLGHEQQAYFISQWFPKPAVYDHKGWHPMPYLDQGEFYSEIGSYDVTISLPANYIVMATGNCQTDAEVYRMDSISKLPLPADTLYRSAFPKSSSEYKTIRFTENNVRDFAWFADKRWIVRQDTISGEGNEGVTKIMTAFLPEHQKEWLPANDILKLAISSYGTSVGRYPYQTIKAVEGDMNAGGGMEYPTIALIDKSVAAVLPTVLIHEAGHNWFYGLLASNERDFPWMDEGMNTFYERKISNRYKDILKLSKVPELEEYLYFQLLSVNRDQPAALRAGQYTLLNYGADVYYKPSFLLQWLEAYMGDKDFERGMKAYFTKWVHKHPYPEDFRKIMQEHTAKKLDWFFDHALYTDRKIDLKVKKAWRKDGIVFMQLRNRSDFPAPLAVAVLQNDTVLKRTWIEPFKGKVNVPLGDIKEWEYIKLEHTYADYKLSDNILAHKGIWKKSGLSFQPGLGMNRSAYYKVFYAPIFAYNEYNGFGPGLLLHNLSFPQNRFQFAVAPVFSVGSKNINGVGAFSYSWFPRSLFKEIRLQTDLKSFAQGKSDLNISDPLFARYTKVAPSLELVFKEKEISSKVQRKLLLKQYTIREKYFVYTVDAQDSLYRPSLSSEQNKYALLRYTHDHASTFHPFSYNAEVLFAQTFIKLGAEAKLRIDYDTKNKSLYIRGYAGKFIHTDGSADNSRYWLNTAFSGTNDYLFDGTYFGRNKNDGLLSKQVSIQEGGFKIPTNLYARPLGRTDNWLLALNLKTDLPFGRLPVRAYADLGTYADARQLSGTAVLFNAGVELHLFGDMLSIYAPLVMSQDYASYLSGIYNKNKFLKSISFSLNIQQLNWLRFHERIFNMIGR